MSPVVSVCLPVFNGERYLAEAIESVLAQTCQDFELLISDDCSQDSSPAIIEHYAQRNKRILNWRNRRNKGLFANYNETMQRASGEYIKLFAQDDLFEPDMLEASVAVLSQQANVALVSARRKIIDHQSGDITALALLPPATKYVAADVSVPGLDVVQKSMSPVVNFIGEPSTVAFRAKDMGTGFDCRFYHLGDLDYWLRLLHHGDYWFLDRPLCSFRQHPHSRSATNFRGILFVPDQLRLWRKLAGTLQALGCSEEGFYESAVKSMSDEVAYLAGLNYVDAQSLKSPDTLTGFRDGASDSDVLSQESHLRLTSDLLDFREAAFHALRILAKTRHDSLLLFSDQVAHAADSVAARVATFECRAKERRIKYLERVLRMLLSSVSWRSTRLLRELRRRLILRRSKIVRLPQATANTSDQDAYIGYLRKEIRRLKGSRSWKLTGFLRL